MKGGDRDGLSAEGSRQKKSSPEKTGKKGRNKEETCSTGGYRGGKTAGEDKGIFNLTKGRSTAKKSRIRSYWKRDPLPGRTCGEETEVQRKQIR